MFLNKKKERIFQDFATNSNCLIPITLQHGGIYRYISNLDNTECIV